MSLGYHRATIQPLGHRIGDLFDLDYEDVLQELIGRSPLQLPLGLFLVRPIQPDEVNDLIQVLEEQYIQRLL
jgi:hypothetical protein